MREQAGEIRKALRLLHRDVEIIGEKAGKLEVHLRQAGDDAFAVVANAGEDALDWEVDVPTGFDRAEVVSIRGGQAGDRAAEITEGTLRLTLPARDGMVVRLD